MASFSDALPLNHHILRGNAALWLGEDQGPWLAEAVDQLKQVPWLAIWTASKRQHIAEQLKQHWGDAQDDKLSMRMVRPVPGRLEESLGTYYALSDFCPIYFLNGVAEVAHVAEREIRRGYYEKVDELERLGGSLLVVAGVEDRPSLAQLICDEFQSSTDDLRIVIVGVSEHVVDEIASDQQVVSTRAFSQVSWIRQPLTEVLQAVLQSAAPGDLGVHSVDVNGTKIPIESLLKTRLDPPIDQHFTVVSTSDIAAAADNEDRDDLIEKLIAGERPFWRAFAHELHWKRNRERCEAAQDIFRDLQKLGDHPIACLNVIGERGAGLTTCIHEIAFSLARSGCATLVQMVEGDVIDPEAIRIFAANVEIELSERLKTRNPKFTIVVAIEGDDSFDGIHIRTRELLGVLAHDGRSAIIIRGVSAPNGAEIADIRDACSLVRARGRAHVQEFWMSDRVASCSPLKATLSEEESADLAKWAREHWPETARTSLNQIFTTWGADWDDGRKFGAPLLICLYFILKGQLETISGLGEHLVSRATGVPTHPREIDSSRAGPNEANAVLSGEAFAQARDQLIARFNRPLNEVVTSPNAATRSRREPDERVLAEVLLLLCALGCLRLPISRRAICDLLSLDSDEVSAAVRSLEESGIAEANLYTTESRAMPSAYYESTSLVGLRHPAYGRVLLDWMASLESGDDYEWIRHLGSAEALLEVLSGNRLASDYPLETLDPYLRTCPPTTACVEFVSNLSVKYLRVQKTVGSHYQNWLHKDNTDRIERVVKVLDSIPERVALQRSAILHSRGISRYKSCRRVASIEEVRQRYEQAWKDFDEALARARSEATGEKPEIILTSKGLSFLFKAKIEREKGYEDEAQSAEASAYDTLQAALAVKPDNTYAAYGLAEYLLDRTGRVMAANAGKANADDQQLGGWIAEAGELLQAEPPPKYLEQWDGLVRKLSELLSGTGLVLLTQRLIDNGNELGYALRAFAELGGRIPDSPTDDPGERNEIGRAKNIIEGIPEGIQTPSALADVLRYALFTADVDRLKNPRFDERYRLLQRFVDSAHFRNPVWMYDYAMLSMQTDHVREAQEVFADLRKGARFYEVPLDRAVYLSKHPHTYDKRRASLRITRLDANGKGWGRVDTLPDLKTPVPFKQIAFKSGSADLTPGRTIQCVLRLQPSGPLAEPIDR